MSKIFNEISLERLEGTDLPEAIGYEIKICFPDQPLRKELLELTPDKDKFCRGTNKAFNIYAFSDGESSSGFYLNFHAHDEGAKMSHVTLGLSRKPNTPPPAKISKSNELTGGYPEALNRIFQHFPQESVICTVSATFVPVLRLPARFTRKEKPPNGLSYLSRNVTYAHESDHGLTKITVKAVSDQKLPSIQVEGKLNLKPSPSCIDEAANALWAVAKQLYDEDHK